MLGSDAAIGPGLPRTIRTGSHACPRVTAPLETTGRVPLPACTPAATAAMHDTWLIVVEPLRMVMYSQRVGCDSRASPCAGRWRNVGFVGTPCLRFASAHGQTADDHDAEAVASGIDDKTAV